MGRDSTAHLVEQFGASFALLFGRTEQSAVSVEKELKCIGNDKLCFSVWYSGYVMFSTAILWRWVKIPCPQPEPGGVILLG